MKKITVLMIILLMSVLAFVASCKKLPYTAPPGSVLYMSSDKQMISLNESTRISIQGYMKDGQTLWDGTVIYFTITRGILTKMDKTPLESNSIELKNGNAELLAWGKEFGEMEIVAISGSSGTDTSSKANSVSLKINVGTVGKISVSLNKQYLPLGGGTVTITAFIFDKNDKPMNGMNVYFKTTKGKLNSNGSPVVTNANGKAHDQLETTESADVTVSCGAADSVTVSVSVLSTANSPTASFTYSPTDPRPKEKVRFNGSASKDSDGTIKSWYWDFGDGDSGWSEIVSHEFDTGNFFSRSFVVTLTVTDNQGLTGLASQTIPVEDPVKINVSPVRIPNIPHGDTDPDNTHEKAGDYTINVWNSLSTKEANVDIATSDENNFSISQKTGLTNFSFVVTVYENSAPTPRSAIITVSYRTQILQVELIQDGKGPTLKKN